MVLQAEGFSRVIELEGALQRMQISAFVGNEQDAGMSGLS
jgi:hypothetical protein